MCFPNNWVKSDETICTNLPQSWGKIKQFRVKLSTDKITLAGNDRHNTWVPFIFRFIYSSFISPEKGIISNSGFYVTCSGKACWAYQWLLVIEFAWQPRHIFKMLENCYQFFQNKSAQGPLCSFFSASNHASWSANGTGSVVMTRPGVERQSCENRLSYIDRNRCLKSGYWLLPDVNGLLDLIRLCTDSRSTTLTSFQLMLWLVLVWCWQTADAWNIQQEFSHHKVSALTTNLSAP